MRHKSGRLSCHRHAAVLFQLGDQRDDALPLQLPPSAARALARSKRGGDWRAGPISSYASLTSRLPRPSGHSFVEGEQVSGIGVAVAVLYFSNLLPSKHPAFRLEAGENKVLQLGECGHQAGLVVGRRW